MVICYRALTPSKERQSGGFHRNQLLALASFLTAFVLLASLLGGCDSFLRAGPSARYAVASQRGKAGSSDEGTGRKKVASGEYLVYEEASEGAVGPFGEKVYDFHESWTLWQTGKGEYEVEGDRRFNTSADLLRSFRFVVRLSRDFTVLRVTEFATLKWISDSGPLTCEFLPKELTLTRFRLAIPDDCNPCSALFPNNEGSRSTVGPCRYCHFAGLCVAGVLGCALPKRRRQRHFVRGCLGPVARG